MSYRQLAGIGALCLVVCLGVARADLVIDFEIYPPQPDPLKPNTDTIRDLAVSPDGKTLVCAGRGGFYFYGADTVTPGVGLPGRVEYATGVAFAPDGKSLYTADAVGNLLRWDLDKRTVAFRFPQVHAAVERIALSADGSTLASTDGTHTAFWDARTGKLRNAWSPPGDTTQSVGSKSHYRRRYERDEEPTQTRRQHLALSSDGRWCVAGGNAQAFQLRAVSAESAKHTWPEDAVAAIDIAPDGKSSAVSMRGGAVEIVANDSLLPMLGCASPCTDCFVRFAPDGKTLVGHQPELGVLAAIDVATGKRRWQHQQAPAWRSTALAFAGPNILATGDSDRRLRLYDLATGTLLKTIALPAEPKDKAREQAAPPPPRSSPHIRQRFGTPHLWHPGPLNVGAFLNDGKELLVIPHRAAPIVFDTQTGQPIRTLGEFHEKVTGPNGCDYAAVSADRRRLFVGIGERLIVWDLSKHRIEHEYGFPGPIVALAVARDGKRFAVAGLAAMHCPQPIYVGTTDLPEIQAFEGHEFSIAYLAFSPDGKRLFSASPHLAYQINQCTVTIPGLIIEWDLATGKAVRRHHHAMHYFKCSPDASLWALQADRQYVSRLFDWEQQKVVGQCECRAESWAFTPDSAALATGGGDQVVHLWDARTGKLLRKFNGHPEGGTAILCFSDDGKLLATHEIGGGAVRLWDVKTGNEICVNPGPRGPIQCVAYSPDGRLIVSAGNDRRLLWWDAQTGRLIGASGAEPAAKKNANPQGHELPVQYLSFSSDGTTLASASPQEILVWNVATRKQAGRMEPTRNLKSMALSTGGKRLITVHSNGGVTAWDVATGKPQVTFNPDPGAGEAVGVEHAVVSPDATHVAVYYPQADEVLVYQVGSKKMVRCLAIAPPRDPETGGNNTTCLALVFSPDGRYLAASVQDSGPSHINRWNRFSGFNAPPRSSIHIWELASGAKTNVIRAIPGAVTTLAFSPDGRSILHGIATGSALDPRNTTYAAHTEAVVRDLTAGVELKQFIGTGPACVCLTTGWELPILSGKLQHSGQFAFSPDGQSALTCTWERTLLTWDARAFAPARTPGIKLAAAEQEAAWADLGLMDGKKVHRAMGDLTRDPQGTLALLKGRLALPVELPAQRLKGSIQALGSAHFSVRTAAQRELAHQRELVESALKEALASERDLQRRRGLEALLAHVGDDLHPECLRERRAVEVLEKLDDAGARAWLAELAAGPAQAQVTREAAAALARLRMRAGTR